MNENLVERIKEFQKCREKLVTIGAEVNKESDNLRRYVATEKANFDEYVERERRDLEKRLANEKCAFEEKLKDESREFEEKIQLMREECDKVLARISSLGENVVSIRMGDLIEELANLGGISTSDVLVGVYIDINIVVHTIEEMHELVKQGIIKDSNYLFQVASSSNLFYCRMELSTDLSSIQADGKTFLEHCVVVPGMEKTHLNGDVNRDDLIINMPLSKLPIKPDIISQAIINCVERSQEKEVSKKRSRKLSDETNK